MATELGNFVVGEVLGADDLNTIATWSSFTVTTTGSAAMTFTGVKCVVNKLCVFQIIGTGSGPCTPPVTVTLPETMATLNGAVGFQAAYFSVTGNIWYYGPAQRNSGTVVSPRVWNSAATYLSATSITNLIPFGWALNDLFVLNGTYRIA